MSKNLFTKIGRPAAIKPLTAKTHPSTGEKQGQAPSDGFRPELPGSAYRTGGKVCHHDDPTFYGKRGRK